MRMYTMHDAERIIAKNLHRLRGFDTIIGLPRSGMIFASFIATQLEVSLADVATAARSLKVVKHGHLAGAPLGKCLLVEDVVNRGVSLQQAFEFMKRSAPALKREDVTTCSVWTAPTTVPGAVDIDLGGPHDARYAFTWQMWHSALWPAWCTDMDGVLCMDSPGHNDDHEAYGLWSQGVTPRWLVVPKHANKFRVGAIITSRPEGIRRQTLEWLTNHSVYHDKLIMVPVKTEKEVNEYFKANGLNRGSWKAREANKLEGMEMFIESDPRQAAVISKTFNGLVWCTDSQERFRGGIVVGE